MMVGQSTNSCELFVTVVASMPIKSSGRIVPPGWAPLQPKQSVLSLIVYSPLSNTGNVLNKRNIGPLGQKLIKITHLISVTEDQVSFFE